MKPGDVLFAFTVPPNTHQVSPCKYTDSNVCSDLSNPMATWNLFSKFWRKPIRARCDRELHNLGGVRESLHLQHEHGPGTTLKTPYMHDIVHSVKRLVYASNIWHFVERSAAFCEAKLQYTCTTRMTAAWKTLAKSGAQRWGQCTGQKHFEMTV